MNSCPLCHHNTLKKLAGLYCCERKECNFIELNPISYADEVIKYQQELSKQISRISFKEDEFLSTERGKFIKSCKKSFFDACHFMKYPEIIGNSAMALLSTLVKVDAFEHLKTKKSLEQNRNKNIASSIIKKTVSYILYVVCYQNKFLFEELKIAKYFSFSFKEWKQNIMQQNSRLKPHINDYPPIKSPYFLINKVCLIQKVRDEERQAMLKLCDNLTMNGRDSLAATIASIAFWKICEYSLLYRNDIKLEEICKNHELLYNSQILNTVEKTEKYFDITSDCAKTTYQKFYENTFLKKYLPEWEGRDNDRVTQEMNRKCDEKVGVESKRQKNCEKKVLKKRKKI